LGSSGGGGTSTTSSQSGPAKYAVPYAQQQTGIAKNLFTGSGYPSQQTAGFSPDQLAAMQGVEGMTGPQQGISNATQMSNLQLALGMNPAINQATGALSGIAGGQNPLMQQAYGANQGLLNNPYINQAQQANAAIVGGANLDPSSNPALQSYINAGLAPMVSNYQQAVAPNILQNAVASGGLGSSGTEQAFQNAQSALANQMGNYTSQVIEPAYEAGLAQQQQAIQGAPGLLAPSETGISNLQGLVGQQQQAASAIPGMLSPQQSAISQTPGLQTAAYGPTSQLGQVGQQQQQQQQNVLNTLFGNQMTPYQMSQMGSNLISALSGGGGQSFQVSSQPGGGSMK
jgi:hypothetical protein